MALLFSPLPVAGQTADAAATGDEPTFAAGVETVVVDVVVTDGDGQPVADLGAEDFSVKEGGELQTIASFEAIRVEESFAVADPPAISTNEAGTEAARRSFVLVFDDLNLTPGGALRARRRLQEFVDTIFRPGDLVKIVPTAGGGGWSVRMPEGGDDLIRVLDRLQGRRAEDRSPDRISDYEAMMIHVYRDPDAVDLVQRRLARAGLVPTGLGPDRVPVQALGVLDRAGDVYEQARQRTSRTLEALGRILRSLSSVRGRKAVILVSEGFIHDTDLNGFQAVLQASSAANANLYFLNVRGIESLPTALGVEQTGPATIADNEEYADQIEDIQDSRRFATYEADGSNSLALDSGGFTVKTNDLAKGLQRIVHESRTYYLLGYVPTNDRRDGKFRKIDVDVRRPGVSVRARKGYYAPSDAPVKPAPADEADPVLRAALESPYESPEVPLRMTAYLLEPTADGQTRVLLAGEVDPGGIAFEEREGRFANQLQSVFQVSSRDSEPVYTKERQVDLDLPAPVRERMARTWIPVAGAFDLPEGTYQATLLVRDERGGRVGTVRHRFEVPAAGGFRISTPLLTDTFMSAASDASGPAPVPIARRSFSPGVEMVCTFDVFGARLDPQTRQPQVALRYGVRRADGPPPTLHAQGIGPGPDGQLQQRIKVPLRGVPPGEYEILLRVEDELAGESVERWERFEIAAPEGLAPPPGTSGPGADSGPAR